MCPHANARIVRGSIVILDAFYSKPVYKRIHLCILFTDAQQWKPAKLAPIGGQQPIANAGVTVGRTDWAAK